MQTHQLQYHPAHPPLAVRSVEAKILSVTDNWLRLRWRVDGVSQLVIPKFAGKGRQDDLWKTTCFELFVQRKGEAGYTEFNLSPSERWAAYDFAAPRERMTERNFPREPELVMRTGQAMAIFDAALPRHQMPDPPCNVGLTAVIEEGQGTKSYWAIAHGKDEPDFHDPACFLGSIARTRAA